MGLVNNNPGTKLYTLAQLGAFTAANPVNLISYFAHRNPTAVYAYIMRNYPGFGRMANGMQKTDDGMNNMYQYLVTQYNRLPASAQPHWLVVFGHAMPDAIETQNWTTPA